jgi:phospholipid transport system substrate-binding protein
MLRLPLLSLLALLVATPALAANNEVVRPLKVVVGSVRYGRDKAALKYFDGEAQGKLLLGPSWDKATAAQRTEFVQLFETLFAKMAFPKVRTNFEHLESILYDEPKVDGDKATVDSTILILHPLKKQELKVKYLLTHQKSGWKVVDVSVLGDSTLGGIREEQVKPILQESGMDGLLKIMRAKAKELESVQLK